MIVLMNLIFSRINKERIEELTTVNNLFLYLLVVLNGILVLFHLALLINHGTYICTGQTTSERIRRKKGAKNPFSNGSICKNIKEFWNYPMKYKEKIEYNDKASKFLDTNILICDYLSGNYYVTPTKKIISQTLIDKGYSYDKATIELIEKSNPSSEEETNDSIKLDEAVNNDNIENLNS